MSDTQREVNTTLNDKVVEIHPKVVPSEHGTVHADKIMVGIDWPTHTATLTLLSMHPQPQVGSDWVLAEVNWQIVGGNQSSYTCHGFIDDLLSTTN